MWIIKTKFIQDNNNNNNNNNNNYNSSVLSKPNVTLKEYLDLKI